MQEKIGYIGLGIMGRPSALNLLRAGYPLWVYARRPTMMAPLTAAGASACDSPAEVASRADVIFINVTDTPNVQEVILGDNGILLGGRRGKIVVDMSTIAPSATRELAKRLAVQGMDMLDAPVSGGQQGAIDGTLSIMVGGKQPVFRRVYPLLEVLGNNIVFVGDHGAGQVCKACNQVLVAQMITAVGEALLLAEASGVDPEKVRQALLGGFAHSRVLDVHGRRMLDHDFTPGFKAKLHRKDMRIALNTASELGIALPGAALSTQLINALMGTGKGEWDSAATFTLQQTLSGIQVGPNPKEIDQGRK